MSIELLIAAALISATPILFAGLGELLTERAGVLNLGIEGTMLIGAITGFVFASTTSSAVIGILAAIVAGCLWGLLFAFAVVTLRLNQVVTGLAFTILGSGLSAFIGNPFVGRGLSVPVWKFELAGVSAIPVIGRILAEQDVLVIVAFALTMVAGLFLSQMRAGLILRTLGESPETLDTIGQSVAGLRYFYTIIGSGLMALGGAYLSVITTPSWVENMTAGRGWIALGLVIFASWRPSWVACGAVMFGLIDAYRFRAQIGGTTLIDPHFLNMLPYIATLVVLGLIGRSGLRHRLGAPAALGVPYDRERR